MVGILVLLKLALFAATARVVDFPPTCDDSCRASYKQTLPLDSGLWENPDISSHPLYSTPENLDDYSVGSVIKWQDELASTASESFWVPSGLSLSRFSYVSQDVNGTLLPATAYVLTPYHNSRGNDTTFPVVVWAHGTAGYTSQCAPSNDKRLQYHWQAPFALAQQGYVVIAPDYAGLGTTIPNGFMYNAGIAHANDVSLAVKAARAHLHNQLSNEWVVVGHSEGGLTAWRTAQREADQKRAVGGFIGAVAISPAMEVMSLVPWVIEKANGGPFQEVFIPYMLRSIARLFPSFDLAKYATKKLIDISELTTNGYLNVAIPLLWNMTLADMYLNDANFTSAPEVHQWEQQYHGNGSHELGGPLLVLHGGKDFILPHMHIEKIFDEQCDAFPKSAAQYQLLPGLDHDGVIQASHSVYFPWIADRFNGKKMNSGCNKGRIHPATQRFSTVEQVWMSGWQLYVE
ncbi:hypothetical protein ASPSYDRAFT_91783 [Aspergillus sydowii CBS 593.65]|uniref:Uncharacterized protein n=1 Tax=Aspergillus sydowii CBS 593.65 TaxID=1036612 RepID=A0A1L9TAS5_9EURO|nr:uncharacterized protein ASPSYDRAFT_91783 [Aspergillus sydowii CBS 593.65]OJJ56524.1 hypothetical protein ASPSYDRAFT_91783 [Aspergillus sydowii CBS 593.65]